MISHVYSTKKNNSTKSVIYSWPSWISCDLSIIKQALQTILYKKTSDIDFIFNRIFIVTHFFSFFRSIEIHGITGERHAAVSQLTKLNASSKTELRNKHRGEARKHRESKILFSPSNVRPPSKNHFPNDFAQTILKNHISPLLEKPFFENDLL